VRIEVRMTQNQTTTIYVLSSAPGRAGVAVIRISGPKAGPLLDAVTVGKRPLPRRAMLRALVSARGEKIDRGLVLWLPGPQSFTGEDCAELHIHGGRAVVARVLEELGRDADCRLAEAGEFARRGFDNGKIDLAEAEGLADLIDAETDAQRRQALAQAEGALSRLTEGWRLRLIQAQALAEAAIDFSDEGDVSAKAMTDAAGDVTQLAQEIKSHLADGHRGEILRDGFQVVLVGPPNIGKSSLLNALARRDAAIVTPEAGTTRDVLEVHLDLKGYPVVVCDTAGLRDTDAAIEQEGIRRARQRAEAADLVLWLGDGIDPSIWPSHGVSVAEDRIVPVISKADMLSDAELADVTNAGLAVSAKTGAGLDALIAVIADAAKTRIGDTGSGQPTLTQARHRQAVEHCVAALEAFEAGPLSEAELRAEDLRRAATALGRITGRVDVEDVLDQVFGRFCIGK
jgi:tRNA modification GTPase